MPLTIFFGLLTLAPLVMALVIAGLGLARRATTGVALGLTLVGVVIPIIGLALLAPEVSAGLPLEISLLGGQSSWVALFGRADALSVYAAIGVAVIVAPLLLWLAWRAAPLDAAEEAEIASSTDDDDDADDETAQPADDEAPITVEIAAPRRALGRWQWVGLALTLALESLALWVCFAENIVMLGIVWVALIVVAWGLGELSSEAAIFDWRGLALMVVGPIVWLVTVLLIAAPADAPRLLDLTGAARLPTGHLFVISLALAFAAGAYPALAWLRKRASIATPAGLAAVSLAVMPAALFVGIRTFSIGATTSSSWATLNIGKPPLTIGILLTLLGAVSVAIAGLLALGRRDPRSLLASLTLAQAGWGLLGLGVGAPLSVLGITLLLATAVIGLGAIIAALVASGAITADIEPESAGPRILGEPLRPALFFAWLIGAASLVGAPLFAGFAPQQLISAEALTGPRLVIPLMGLAWIGSALLAIAIVRATAPAFSAPLVAIYTTDADAGDGETAADDASDTDDAEADVTEDVTPVASPPELRLEELPGIALGVLLLIAGIAPGIALTLAGGAAATALQAGALNGLVVATSSGYTAGVGQWFVTAPVIFVVIGALVLAYIRSRMPREIRPLYLAGQTPDALRADVGAADGVEEPAAELVALPEPTETWSDLRRMLRSGWLTPAGAWLGLDNEDSVAVEDDEGADEEGDDDDSASAEAKTQAPMASDARATSATNGKAKGGSPQRARAVPVAPDEAAEGAGEQA